MSLSVFYGDPVYKLRRVMISKFHCLINKKLKRLRRRQYASGIIEKTRGLQLGLSTAMHRLFLKQRTLNNKAVGTKWHLRWLLVIDLYMKKVNL